MHGDTLNKQIDDWLKHLGDEHGIEIEIVDRTTMSTGETMVIEAEDNPWEVGHHESSALPRMDEKIRMIRLGAGYDEERNLHFAYCDLQRTMGVHVEATDQHRIHLWIGRDPSEDAMRNLRDRYEEAIREGIWTHLMAANRMINKLAPSSGLGPRVSEEIGKINRRMA